MNSYGLARRQIGNSGYLRIVEVMGRDMEKKTTDGFNSEFFKLAGHDGPDFGQIG